MEVNDWNQEWLNGLFAPGRDLDILLAGRSTWQEKAVRRAKVLGLAEGDLALSSPEPALPQPVLGRAVEITVLDKRPGARSRRYGYQTSVLDVVSDYPGQTGSTKAVVVMFPRADDVYPTNLRRAKRFAVPSQGFLGLALEGGDPVRLLDISVKGLRFLHPEIRLPWQVDGLLRPTLIIHEQPYPITGRVAGIKPAASGTEVSMELGVLHLDAWTSLLVALHELEHGPEGRKEGWH
jgi:hypothetical protein